MTTLPESVADSVVPEYRKTGAPKSCTSEVAKRWNAAYEAAALVLSIPEKKKPEPVSRARRALRAGFMALAVPAGVFGAVYGFMRYVAAVLEYFRPETGFYVNAPYVIIGAIALPAIAIVSAIATWKDES